MSRAMALRGARALVTGASSGIGRAVAIALADAGASVAVHGRHPDALDAVRRRTGGPAIAADLLDEAAPERVVDDARAALGGLDVVVGNAGGGWAGPLTSMSAADADRIVALNLGANIHVARAALPTMVEQRSGRLVFVGSIAGLLGVADEAAYSAAKAGLGGLTEALRSELVRTGVGVTLVSPGVVDTPFFTRRNRPYGRRFPPPISPGRVAEATIRAIAQGRDDVVVPGWLRLPVRLHATAPRTYRALAARLS